MSEIIYGPQGCGKTKNAELIKNHFGLSKILDDFKFPMELPPDTLALTNFQGYAGALDYSDVMAEIAEQQKDDIQAPDMDEAFNAWSSTWDIADMTMRDIFNAGFNAGSGGNDE